jgi:hypothetical protein
LQALLKSPVAQGPAPSEAVRDDTTKASDITKIFSDMAIFYLHPYQCLKPPTSRAGAIRRVASQRASRQVAVLSLWVAVSPPLLRFCEAKRWGQNDPAQLMGLGTMTTKYI